MSFAHVLRFCVCNFVVYVTCHRGREEPSPYLRAFSGDSENQEEMFSCLAPGLKPLPGTEPSSEVPV